MYPQTIGIVIKSDFRGQGYMRPAINQLISIAKELNVDILCDTVPENRKSALKVFYDWGFKRTREHMLEKI